MKTADVAEDRAEGRQGWDTPVQFVKGVGPARAKRLANMSIETVRDLLFCLPRKHVDRTEVVPIAQAVVGERVAVCGVVAARQKKGRGQSRVVVRVKDDSGQVEATWFNQPYILDAFREGQTVILSGKLTLYNNLQIVSPEFEILDTDDVPDGFIGIAPVYPLTQGISQRQMRRVVANALEDYGDNALEIFPPGMRSKAKLMPAAEAFRQIHFPDAPKKSEQALRRFKYEELFLLQLGMALRRRILRAVTKGERIVVTPQIDKRIRARFPFPLTADQDRVIETIRADMESDSPMNRLLQGDVGCGKTAVALYAMLATVANRRQAALMAPTEILAEQHDRTVRSFLRDGNVRIVLLTGGMPARDRTKALQQIAAGDCDIAIGTHALLREDLSFHDLGLVVVDEQHKFGVVQRGTLREKGLAPDVLVMTATPIPRTLSLTVFGDLDVSEINQMPPGRGKVETFLADNRDETKRRKAMEFVKRKVAAGAQAFFVYPLVDDAADSAAVRRTRLADVKSATATAKELAAGPLGKHGVQLLHGRMKADQKDEIMARFRAGEFHVLVATVLIEVGLDIPNATVMVIENAERFGLSQLHQLRGRIGRGAKKSFCILLGDTASEQAKARLETIVATTDGFKIAEQDLRMRGPGQFFGTRQHGLPELKVADLIEDYDLLVRARRDAVALVEKDPKLVRKICVPIRRAVLEKYGEVLELVDVG